MSHTSAFHRDFTLKRSLHLPNPRAADPDVVILRDRMKFELADQGSNCLQYICHGEISTNTHAVSNTEWNKAPAAVGLVLFQPSIRSKYRMILAPDLRIMMENVVSDADISLFLRFKDQYCGLNNNIDSEKDCQNLHHTVRQSLQFSLRWVTQHFAIGAW